MPHVNASITQATTSHDFEAIRALFRDYGAYLAAGPSGAAGISIDGFEQEIASLPGPYAFPSGVLLIAHANGATAGCVALRPVRPNSRLERDEQSCEMKRLWICDGYRGLGLGRQLVQYALAWAHTANYQAVYLDTAPAAMPAAHKLYQDLGFKQVDRYNDNPVPGIVFCRLSLSIPSEP